MPPSGPDPVTCWRAPDARAVPAALDRLGDRYRVVTRPAVPEAATWLDTADWRLHRAGLALARRTAPDGTATLELRAGDGAAPPLVVPDAPGADPGPRLLGALPGALADELRDVVDVRALLPVVDVRGTLVPGALLDGEGKTVVRLEQRHPATAVATSAELLGAAPAEDTGGGPAAGATDPVVRLLPVRGYRRDAARAARALRAAGLEPCAGPAYRAALDAAGLDPRPPSAPAVRAGDPAPAAVAGVLLGFLDALEAALPGTLADVDTEFLHDARVAVRRSRSAVKLLGDALPPRLVAWAGPQLKWLGDLTTPVRDLDVHLLGLPAAAAGLRGTRPEHLEPLAGWLSGVRDRERRALVRGLRTARLARFRTRWRAELAAVAADPEPGAPAAGGFGIERVARAHRRVLRGGRRIVPESPPELLHDLRKRGKELRYLLEVFGGLLEPGVARPLVRELKGLQDVLGAFQDSEVQADALVRLAEDMLAADAAPATTYLAMGELAARLHDDQVAARAEFARRFDRFAAASPAGGIGR